MKNSQLKNIIRESIKKINNKQSIIKEIETFDYEACMKTCTEVKLTTPNIDWGNLGAVFEWIFLECNQQCMDEWETRSETGVENDVENDVRTTSDTPSNNDKRRKITRKLNELSASSLTGYFSDLTSDRGPSGVQVDDDVRSDLIGLALPAIEQTKIDSPKIATLVSNLLILKNEYDTTGGMALKQQPEEVQKAVEYLSNKDALAAFKEITDIDEAIAAALKLGANPTEKIYTATAFPDGMRDSDFYKKAVEDGYSFILKPYLNGRSAQTLPVGDDGFMINEFILRMKKLANII